MNVYVQFSDSTASQIIAAFGCPQDAEAFPNQFNKLQTLKAAVRAAPTVAAVEAVTWS